MRARIDRSADGNNTSLMDGDYDRIDKSFSRPAEQAVLNDASHNAIQVVWLDFDALQPGLLAVYKREPEPFVAQ